MLKSIVTMRCSTEVIGRPIRLSRAIARSSRILSVPRIPLPAHPRVIQLARRVGLLNADTAGLTAGYGVIVRLDCTRTFRLLAQEFVHVAQYEGLGKEGNFGQKGIEIAPGKGPVEGRCRPLVMGLKGKQGRPLRSVMNNSETDISGLVRPLAVL